MIDVHSSNGILSLRLHGPLITGDGAEALHRIPKADKVVVYIDSIGGCSFEMSGLVSALLLHADTQAFITGNAFSAAAIIARSCLQTTIHSAGQLMVHRCQMSVLGQRADFQRAITTLSHLDTIASLVFSFRGVTPAEVLRLEAEGDHYHSPLEALRVGLVDPCIHELTVRISSRGGDRPCF